MANRFLHEALSLAFKARTRTACLAISTVLLVCLVYSQMDLQVGYAVITAGGAGNAPVGTALFTYTNPAGVTLWQAGVGAVEPVRSARIFVDQQGTRTSIALVNPSDQNAVASLVLRDSSGTEVSRKKQQLAPHRSLALFVNEIFPSLSPGFIGSLTFESDQKLAAITLRESQNILDEPIYSALPVADLSTPGLAGSMVFPQIGAGGALSTQLVLINRGSQRISGLIKLFGSDGAPLPMEVNTDLATAGRCCFPAPAALQTTVAASEFPYQIEPDGIYRAQLSSASGPAVGYAIATVEQGNTAPAGSAIFQFKSNDRVITESGVAAAASTTRARIFVDNTRARTGLAIASADNPQTTVTFDLIERSGDSLQQTTRILPSRGHLSIFVDELFPDLPANFSGLLEITSPLPLAATTLRLSINQRNQPILTTLPIADLIRPILATSFIFPQVGFGSGYSTSLVFINADKTRVLTGIVSFLRPDGTPLATFLGGQSDSRFPYRVLAGSGIQLKPGQRVAAARIVLDPLNPTAREITVNEGSSFQIRARVIDSDGDIRDEIPLKLSSLSTDVATVDDLGRVEGRLRGFASLLVSGGGLDLRATITVAKITRGVPVVTKSGLFAEGGFTLTGIVQDLAGRVYLADSGEHTILFTPDIESAAPNLYAGVPQTPGFREDERLKALFQRPSFLALNQYDGTLYVSDSDNNVIRQVRAGPSGRADTFAGNGQPGSLDGPAGTAAFNNPQGIALDNRGNLWIADANNHIIRRVSLDPSRTKIVETIAGNPGIAGAVDGVGADARFNFPAAIALETEPFDQQLARERTGSAPPPITLIVADSGNGLLRRVREDGVVETIGALPGKALSGPRGTAPANADRIGQAVSGALRFKSPTGVAVDAFGNIYVSEAGTGELRALLRNGDLTAAAQAKTFDSPRGIAITRAGQILVADGTGTGLRISYGEPAISNVAPNRASNRGGALVTISGKNFAPDTTVIAGGAVVEAQVSDTHTLTFALPPLISGRLTLTVQNRGGVAQAAFLVDPVPLSDLLPGEITTVAGGTTFIGDGGSAVGAALFSPQQIAVDSAGDVFVADANHHRIRKINPGTQIITTVAGNGQADFAGDGGPAIAASLAFPRGIAIDAAGNLYVADTANSRIRKINQATGIITTVAGRGLGPFAGDNGPAVEATLNAPRAVAVDAAGNLLIADTSNHRIRRVDAKAGVITTIAGTDPGLSGDGGPAIAAQLRSPQGIAVDASGNVLIADTLNHRIRRIDAATKGIMTIAGTGQAGFSGDSQRAGAAMLNLPGGVAVDVNGTVFIGDTANHRVRKIDASTQIILTLAGTGVAGFSGDGGPAGRAALSSPYGIASNSAGELLIVDQGNTRIRIISSGGITTLAGNGQESFLGDNEPATAANLLTPQGIAVDSAGNLFIADSDHQRIRRVAAGSGTITSVAGTGTAGFPVDNIPAISSPLSSPAAVSADGNGNLYISDTRNNRIRKVDGTGIITTLAGDGRQDFSGDNGPAASASLNVPRGITLSGAGQLYVADRNNNRIRRVDLRSGLITTVAGSARQDASGDNGPATDAGLNRPEAVAVDGAGNLLIADNGNHRIRRVDAMSGTITTVAGNGQSGFSGDNGPATAARIESPVGIKVDAAGNLFISESTRIRRVAARTGVITTVAGNGRIGFSGDNIQATKTPLTLPSFLDFDPNGNLLFADTGNYRIRGIRAPIP